MTPKVKFSHVSKTYKLYKKNTDKLLDLFSISKKRTKTFYALQDISFEVFDGETIGVIGTNGSGKSTLSNLLSESVPHTSGSVTINGDPSLIAISAGLDKNLTGLDNIQQKSLMHGLKSKEIKQMTEKIMEFADLGDFIYQPVKNYSSGMKSRLGFAISVHTNPDLLIIDEALSVGDQTFYKKCIDKINEFKKEGKTIFFVSHSISQVRSISDRVMWVHFGRIKEFGDAKTVLENYETFIKWFNKLTEKEKKHYKTEMLQQQTEQKSEEIHTNTDLNPLSRTNRIEKPKKQRNFSLFFQIILLLSVSLLSGAALFSSNPLSAVNQFIEKQKGLENQTAEDEPTGIPASVNQDGMIIGEKTAAYTDPDKEKSISLPFSAAVFVEEEINDLYKITYMDQTLYADKNEVKLTAKSSFTKSSSTIEQFEPLFPDTFFESYEYFLAQLGLDYDAVSTKLKGYSESADEQGLKMISLGNYAVAFRFNQEEIADEIIISNIESDQAEELISQAQVVSANKQQYFLLTESYEYVLDTATNTVTMKKTK
ncbi:teichoic acids export ABC transporter ATP-binding subunit TagH [Bacillus sp. V2I10]|uniref:teichoic acids export ABC transporter ATP-binding subunit TagH n=1 Tax=Bacillus sp. V2I10 TaxID=3042276 RepID=UPI00278143DF|nr:teichoic acids export ABC transporter ATP-binding subunit TagH [Bacillus sp. V2I10]MDQ0857194.1 teichoic acid transport system ATP-binding protein [Bacillus sp. V2I10]